MAKRKGKKTSKGSVFTVIAILIIMAAIGSGGNKKENKDASITKDDNKTTVTVEDDKTTTTKKENETISLGNDKEVSTAETTSTKNAKEATSAKKEDTSNQKSIEKKEMKSLTSEKTMGNQADKVKTKSRTPKETEFVESKTSKKVVEPETIASTEKGFESIQKGNSGDSVKEVQTKLITLGYLTLAADGKFGPGTEQAVKDFQTGNRLDATGIIDKKTYDVLVSKKAVSKKQEEPSFTSIKRGDNGDAVKEIQTQLASLGYLSSSTDGKFGPGTEQAVQNFQDTNHLDSTGIVDEKTYKKLFSSEAKHYVAPVLTLDAEESTTGVGTRSASGPLVWIPTHGGTKYHLSSSCSGMEGPIQVTISEAQSRGFTPCKKCYR